MTILPGASKDCTSPNTLAMFAHAVGVKWHRGEVSVAVSLVANKDEHPDTCLLAICTSSFMKFLRMSFAPEKIVVFLEIADF